ncbi:hypothetical protein DDB_G0289561, partial [Dictyostelium discoideum AX4]
FYNNETTIVFEYNLNDEYFTKWFYFDNNYFAIFSCFDNSTNRICEFLPSISDMDKLYSNKIFYCSINPSSSSVEECNNSILKPSFYPTPIISKDFKPPTKGGQVVIKGSFLISSGHKFPTQYGDVKVEIPNSGLINPTNITIKSFPFGCGEQTIRYYNNKLFKFQYSNPILYSISIEKINEYSKIKLIINGDNFCTISDNVSLSIGKLNGLQFNWENNNNNNIISIEYDQIYSGLYNVSLNANGLISNNLLLTFNPEIKSVTSVPKSLGGIITIRGNRLISENGMNDTIVSFVGNREFDCLMISNSESIIECNLLKVVLLFYAYFNINLIVGGQKQLDGTIKFEFDKPYISGKSLTGMNLTLFGEMFMNPHVFINGIELNNNLTISFSSTEFKFTLPNDFKKGSIFLRNSKNAADSNTIIFEKSFNIESIGYSTTRGQLLSFQFNNILNENLNLIPTLTYNSSQLIFNEPLSTIFNKTNGDFKFEVPMGCGSNSPIQGIIGNQIANSTFSYFEPIILRCLTDDFLIICYGFNFGSLSMINSDDSDNNNNNNNNNIKINFLNQIYTNNNISKLDHEKFVIPLKSNNLYNGNISITVCGLTSNYYQLYFKSSIKNEARLFNQYFKSNGGDLIINGHNFIYNKSNFTYLLCDDDDEYYNQIKYNCNFIDNTFYNCPINIIGPFDRKCILNFQNEKMFNIKINYLSPTVNNVILNNLTITGGLITINGSDFYNLTTFIEIGNLNCYNVTFINSNQLNCNLITNNISQHLISNNLYYVNISIFSGTNNNLDLIKNSSTLIFKYDNLLGNSNSNNSNNNNNGDGSHGDDGGDGGGGDGDGDGDGGSSKLKWLIPTIICPVIFVVMVIFIGPELFRRFYTYPPPKPPLPEPGFQRRPYDPPNLNNRLYENTITRYDNDPDNLQLSFVPIQP